MSTLAPVLDLVAVAYEAPVETGQFLASLTHLDVPYTLTVIDNASPDPKVRDVIQRAMPTTEGYCRGARFVFNDQNLGYARAANHGMTLGTAPYGLILNCDTEFLPSQSIAEIIEHFKQHERVGVLGPRTTDEANRITHSGIIHQQGRTNYDRGWLTYDTGQWRDIREVNTVSGATYFVRRSMWDELTACGKYREVAPDAEGAFLPTDHFFEETFCSYHARHHDWQVVYYGRVKMIHKWHRSSTVGSRNFDVPRAQFLSASVFHGFNLAGEVKEETR